MYKSILGILFVSLIWVLGSCSLSNSNNSSENSPIINKAYNTLSNAEKKEIEGDWENATISEKVVNKQMGHLEDESYDGKEVYIVMFYTKRSQVIGDINVYVSKDKEKVIGKGSRE